MLLARHFLNQLLHAFRNLLPIILVVIGYQVLVFQAVPEDSLVLAAGIAVVAVGIALFLMGLEWSVFPVGKNLANQFARRGSLSILMTFGFAIGFGAVIAEPALIAVAEQAELISEGRVNSFTLRLIVALSVGVVIAMGVLRTALGWPLHWIMITGYVLVVMVTYVAPPEIVGLAYDSGGVTTNIVTVPLIAALGIGLAASLQGRNPLIDGFGLVALAVMVPMISVQLYGIWVYNFSSVEAVTLTGSEKTHGAEFWLLTVLSDLFDLVRDLLPMVGVVLFFQFLVLRHRLPNPLGVAAGFLMVLIGLYAFVWGLKLGLFPLGESMASQLIQRDSNALLLLFAFLIGFATTMAEPALIAVGHQAEQAAPGRLKSNVIRVIVALGVAVGITVGIFRIIHGFPLHYFIMLGYVFVIILTLTTPKYIVPLAFDLGGVTTSEVTVPLITALGIGLAGAIDGRSVLIDGFGLIAFASIFPIIAVMLYALIAEHLLKPQR